MYEDFWKSTVFFKNTDILDFFSLVLNRRLNEWEKWIKFETIGEKWKKQGNK